MGVYFPIQNFPKIFPRTSSLLIVPVMSPMELRARFISRERMSPLLPWDIRLNTSLMAALASFSAS